MNIGEEAFESEGSLSDQPMSNLEKVHFIVSHALLQPNLRSVPLTSAPFRTPAPHCLSAHSRSLPSALYLQDNPRSLLPA